MSLRWVLIALTVLWPLSEIALSFARRARQGTNVRDASSLRGIWLSIAVGIPLAVWSAGWGRTAFGISERVQIAIAVSLLLAGIVIRWSAILTLGRFFTVNVAIQSDHHVVREGPFRFVRHPSYLGALLCMAGVGVSFGNWISFFIAMVPYTTAILRRIRIEERALTEALGSAYLDYAKTTWRLIPGVY